MSDKDFDHILSELKTSTWNYIYFFGLSCLFTLPPANILGMAFVAPAVKHTCSPTAHHQVEMQEFQHSEWSPRSIPRLFATTPAPDLQVNDVDWYLSECSMTAVTQKYWKKEWPSCTSWRYDNATFGPSLTSEFDLVCDRAHVRPQFHSLYILGNIFGAPVAGYLSDRFGRKFVLSYSASAYVVLALLLTWLPSLTTILVFRFLLGLLHPAIIQVGYILCLEVCEMKLRSSVGILISIPWALGTAWWGILGYFIRDWRWVTRAANLPGIIMVIVVWVLDESPRWLIVNGDHEKAKMVLRKASRVNKSSLPQDHELDTMIQRIEKLALLERGATPESEKLATKVRKFFLSLFSLFRSAVVRKRILLIYVYFFASSSVFYGMSLSAVTYSSDPFIYMIISGLVEIPAYIVPVPIIAKFGRRIPASVFMLFCSLCLCLLIFIPKDISWLVILVAMTGKLCIASAYQLIYLYGSELIPTEVRLQGLGTSNLVSRLGTMCSVYATDSLELYSWVPSALFMTLSLAAGVAAFLMPETLNRPLPETVDQLEQEERSTT